MWSRLDLEAKLLIICAPIVLAVAAMGICFGWMPGK